ncbi:MAG: hypothetical protein V7693_15585 [Halopseudomonas sabulinigri]
MRDLETAVEASLEKLMCLSHEILGRITSSRGIMFDSATYSEIEGSPTYLLRSALGDLSIPTDAENGNVNRYPGVFCVSDDSLTDIKSLNIAKAAFQSAVNSAESAGCTRIDMRKIYRAMGASRLHPKHAWRQVTILEETDLQSVGFTVAKNSESSSQMTLVEVNEILNKFGAFDIAAVVNNSGAKHIRWHEPVAPHVRANVVWGSKEDSRRQMFYASMPFIIPEGIWPEKRVRFNKPRHHSKRSDFSQLGNIPLPFKQGCSITIVEAV